MANYKPNPTFYRVTWYQGTPTNYTGLTGTQAGGLDGSSALDYNTRIAITGSASAAGTPLANGDSMIINGETIEFTSADNLAAILTKINTVSVVTKVIAHNDVSSNYVTLCNSQGFEGEPITLEEGVDALGKLGFTAGVYTAFPCIVGGAFTAFTNNDTFTINGVTVTMTTAGGLNQAGAVATINALSAQTGVLAVRAADRVQLISKAGQPILTAGANASKLGFPAGRYGGSPATLELSTAKTLANLRYQMVIAQLEQFATPFSFNDMFGTGNYDGSAELDTFSFTVGYERPDQVQTLALPGEPDAGMVLTGTAAVKRAVARGLAATYTANVKLFDPTMETRNNSVIRPNSIRIVSLQADGIDTDLSNLEGNIVVSMIAYE